MSDDVFAGGCTKHRIARAAQNRRHAADESAQRAADTGFISQNVYLFCASEGLHTVVLGWVDRKALHAAMKLKPSQRVILTQPVGFPPEEGE